LVRARHVLPGPAPIKQDGTHRLVPLCWSDEGVLQELADKSEVLADLEELEAATNPRLAAEASGLPGISKELVFGVPYSSIINGCFTHQKLKDGRFNDSSRGAWYAAFQLGTAQHEVAHHRAVELREILAEWDKEEVSRYIDYLADFRGDFHDLRGSEAFQEYLDRANYARSQALALRLLHSGSAGIVYPSVRHRGGTCLACFRPLLVANVRKGGRYRLTFKHAELTSIQVEEVAG
jgi:hypothetical protein